MALDYICRISVCKGLIAEAKIHMYFRSTSDGDRWRCVIFTHICRSDVFKRKRCVFIDRGMHLPEFHGNGLLSIHDETGIHLVTHLNENESQSPETHVSFGSVMMSSSNTDVQQI